MRFLVLSSSRGTTFQAILDRIAGGSLTAPCLGLVTDRPDRGCVEKAKKAGLPVAIVERKDGESREEYDKRLHEAVLQIAQLNKTKNQKRLPADLSLVARRAKWEAPNGAKAGKTKNVLLAAAGWMFVLSPWFIARWKNRIINVHPALLPKHGGTGMYGMKVHEAVLRAGEKETGMTIHLLDEGVDTGKILLQKKCPVLPGDTAETLKERVQGLEREWYPKVLEMIERGKIELVAQ